MRERALAGGLLALLAAAVLGFWLMRPAAGPELDRERVERSDIGAPPERGVQPVEGDEADGEGAGGSRAGGAAVGAQRDPNRTLAGEGPALKRLRAKLRELERIEDDPVPEGSTPAEEDAILARPVRRGAELLEQMHAEVDGLGTEDAARAARARLVLADAHEQMARLLRDRPVPSYLDDDGRAGFLEALDERAEGQMEQAAEAREEAKDLVDELPGDHPLRERLR